jgi:hypothetical protein
MVLQPFSGALRRRVNNVKAIVTPLRVPLQALLVGLAGVGLASLYYHHMWWLALVAVVVAVSAGAILSLCGERSLPSRPIRALLLLESWLLIPIALAAAAAAAVIIVTVVLTVPDSTPAATKNLVGSVSTGITTFLTVGFIAWAADDKNSALADHVRDAFYAHYTRPDTPKAGAHVFQPDSVGERWVFSDEYEGIEGWGRPSRLARAKGIAVELSRGTSNP